MNAPASPFHTTPAPRAAFEHVNEWIALGALASLLAWGAIASLAHEDLWAVAPGSARWLAGRGLRLSDMP